MAFGNNNWGLDMKKDMYGIGLVRSTSFGRKRVALPNMEFGNDSDDECYVSPTPLKRLCSQDSSFFAEKDKSVLEDLPQEILIRILCGVEHDDLKRLFFVSKAVREATLTAKKSHFAFNTPRKTVGFRKEELFDSFNKVETPNAPKQCRVPRSRLTAKKLAEVSVSLFASGDEDVWPRRGLFVEMEL